MSDSVRPHRQRPTRFPHPWDSPGKNTGVGCHFLLQCMKVKTEREVAQSCPTLRDPMDCSPPGSSIHGVFQARVLEWGAIAFSRKENSHPKTKVFISDIALVLSISVMSNNHIYIYKDKIVISPETNYLCDFQKLDNWGGGGTWLVWFQAGAGLSPSLFPGTRGYTGQGVGSAEPWIRF